MAEEEKNEEKEAPEESTTEEVAAPEPVVEDTADAEVSAESSETEGDNASAADTTTEARAESVSPAVPSTGTSEKPKSERAPAGRGPDSRSQGGPQSRGRGRPNYQNQGGRPRRGYFRRKVCRLCVGKINSVDYKDVDMLRRFVTERGKIMPRRMTGTCAKHQRIVSAAVKRARMVALLPYVSK